MRRVGWPAWKFLGGRFCSAPLLGQFEGKADMMRHNYCTRSDSPPGVLQTPGGAALCCWDDRRRAERRSGLSAHMPVTVPAIGSIVTCICLPCLVAVVV